ncbi:outer membrane beta-barrel family protein [Alloprevotella tannerae]|uniref:outer membrane beta-barrel family protein n=1 Tax=Alloprevotella tannerae TaxID=76122 RepID=UPI0028D09BDA|nr:outer membrane beta-barrel family protein [Alloprevotella tannerae]
MKKEIFLIILSLLLNLPLNAQEIRGQIFNERGETVAYANVILLTKSDSTFISGTVTTDDGHFLLPNPTKLSLDDCLIRISSIGYKNIYLTPRVDMGTIMIIEETQQLNEVVVSGKRPVIQMNRGKMQVNVQHTLLARTGDAIQVLSMMPFVSRTTEGISVFGRGTPLIYIDNMKINDVNELQKLSSDEVKNVEINLHPGTNYGNNVKAVINIKTIRKGEGLSVNLTASETLVKHFNHLEFGKLNYRLRKWDFFGGIEFRYDRNESSTRNLIDFDHNSNTINVDQSFNNNIKNKSFNINSGFNFSNNGKNDFGMKYNFSRSPSNRDEMSGTSIYSVDNATKHSEDVLLLGKNEKTNHALNAYYITSWGKGNRLTMNLDYMQGKALSQYETSWAQKKDVDSKNKSDYHLYTGKAEILNPLWGGELHYGLEFSFTKNKYSYHANKTSNTALNESEDENRQRLWGLFSSLSKTFGHFSIEAGGRIEIANYQYFHNEKLNEEVSKDYKKILPYLQIDYDKNAVSMSLSYTNSIHRPSYGQLNSSTVYVDKYTYQRGNPLLLSAYDYILDYVFSWKGLMIDITHTWYKNSLMRTTKKLESTSAMLFTTENIPHYREWSATVSYSSTIKFWRPKIEMSVFKQIFTYHGRNYNKPYFSYELDNLFRLSKHVNLSFDIWGTAAGNLYLSDFKPSFRTDIGLNASLLKNKLAVWIKISDLFNTNKERWSSHINDVYYSKNRKLDTRGVMLQLRYSFNPQRSKYKGRATSSEIIRL